MTMIKSDLKPKQAGLGSKGTYVGRGEKISFFDLVLVVRFPFTRGGSICARMCTQRGLVVEGNRDDDAIRSVTGGRRDANGSGTVVTTMTPDVAIWGEICIGCQSEVRTPDKIQVGRVLQTVLRGYAAKTALDALFYIYLVLMAKTCLNFNHADRLQIY
jgi:hypothetical protein